MTALHQPTATPAQLATGTALGLHLLGCGVCRIGPKCAEGERLLSVAWAAQRVVGREAAA